MITQLPLTSFQSMWISDRFLDILYVRPGIATVGRIIEKAIEDASIQQPLWTYPKHLRFLQITSFTHLALSIAFNLESAIFSFRVVHLMQSVMLH